MMKRHFGKVITMRGFKLLHIFFSVFLFVICWMLFYSRNYSSSHHPKADLLVYVVYAVIVLLLCRTYDAYSLGFRRTTDIMFSLSLAHFLASAIVWLISIFMFMKVTNPLMLVCLVIQQSFWNMVWSYLGNRLYNSFHVRKKTVVVCGSEDDLLRLEELAKLKDRFDVQKYIINPISGYEDLAKELSGFESVVVSGIEATLRNGIVKYCLENDVVVFFSPHVGDVILQGSKHMRNYSAPIMRVSRACPTPEYLFVKRLFDMLMALIGIIVLSPVFLITAIAIKLCDRGSVFYKQVRLTKNGKKFKILKFRSMRTDAEKDGVARLSSGDNDDRVTPVGRIIRKIRIDELPQLWNILLGDMSIVGPRPERPEIAEQYENSLPAFSLRLQVKAGLTGYAQVYGKYNTNPHDKLEMDLMYINKMSVVEDLHLMFATARVLFMKGSTQGVNSGAATAIDKVENVVSDEKKEEKEKEETLV